MFDVLGDLKELKTNEDYRKEHKTKKKEKQSVGNGFLRLLGEKWKSYCLSMKT